MAIKINTPIKDASGVDIPSGAVVTYDAKFPSLKKSVKCILYAHISASAINDGYQPIKVNGINVFNFEISKSTLTSSTNPLFYIENKVKDYVESLIGVGTCEIIDLIPED